MPRADLAACSVPTAPCSRPPRAPPLRSPPTPTMGGGSGARGDAPARPRARRAPHGAALRPLGRGDQVRAMVPGGRRRRASQGLHHRGRLREAGREARGPRPPSRAAALLMEMVTRGRARPRLRADHGAPLPVGFLSRARRRIPSSARSTAWPGRMGWGPTARLHSLPSHLRPRHRDDRARRDDMIMEKGP